MKVSFSLLFCMVLALGCGSTEEPVVATDGGGGVDATDVQSDSAPPSDGAIADDAASGDAASDTADLGTPLDDANIFYLGHSLQGWQAPSMITTLTGAAGVGYRYEAAIGIGANLAWQWVHPDRAEGENPRDALGSRPYDVVVLTEAIPIRDQVTGADSVSYALNFVNLAHGQNPDVQVYLHETWDYLTVDDWHAQVGTDRAYYEQIVDGVNAGFAGRDLRIIPSGQALRALIERIEAGEVPGINNARAIFHDDIHLNNLGWYFIACVQYAAIYQRSPVGLPGETRDRFEGVIPSPPAGAVPVMQQIAWDIVSSDPRSGIR